MNAETQPRGFFKSGEAWVDSDVTRDERITKRHPRCTVCNHPDRHLIEATKVAGAGLDDVAGRFSVHRDALWRHMKNHVSPETKISYLAGPAKLQDLANLASDENKGLLEYLGILRSVLVGQLDRSAQRDKPYEVERVAGRVLDVLKEIGRLTGEVQAYASQTINIQTNVNVLNSPEFLDLQHGLLQLCSAHPDARADIVALFHRLDQKHSAPPRAEPSQAPLLELQAEAVP